MFSTLNVLNFNQNGDLQIEIRIDLRGVQKATFFFVNKADMKVSCLNKDAGNGLNKFHCIDHRSVGHP